MTNSEIIKEIKLINDVKPSRDWIVSNRGDLLLKIKKSDVKRRSICLKILNDIRLNFSFFLNIILPHHFIETFGRPAIVSIVGALILVGGMLTIGLARNTVPGDILYPMKIASENIQITLTKNVEDQTRLEMEFAGRRIDELNRLAAADKLNFRELEEKINKVASKLKNNINTVNTQLAKLGQEGEAKKALEVAREVDRKVVEYTLMLNKISEPSTKVKVAEALDQVDKVGDKALEVMVAKRDEVKDSVSDLEIVEKLNDKIAQAAVEIQNEDVNGQKEYVEQTFKDARGLIQTGDFIAALSKITEGKDIIKKIREKMNNGLKVEENESGAVKNSDETENEKLETEKSGGESKIKSQELSEDIDVLGVESGEDLGDVNVDDIGTNLIEADKN